MWTSARAPSLAEMEAMAHDIFSRLPKTFRDLCEGVIIRVDDFPTEEVLDEMDAATEFDLLGLFHGVGLPHRSHEETARLPNMIWLYAGRSSITGPSMTRRWGGSCAMF
jgi:predicted Zn-dependent protease with MMP-like domain